MKKTTKLSRGHCISNYWIYSDLNPTAPQDPQSYRLNKLSEIEVYFLNEIEVREQVTKKMKRFNTITSIEDIGLLHQQWSLEEFPSQYWPVFLDYLLVLHLPVGIAFLSVATAITWTSFKIFTVKQEKHNAIKVLPKPS